MDPQGATSGRRGGLRCALALVVTLGLAGCGDDTPSAAQPSPPSRERLVVFHAASLALPFAEIERVLEERHPGLDVVRESSSSHLAIRKVTELHRDADVVASADEALIRELMAPKDAGWVALFARNRVVIAYTADSRYRDEINDRNWYRILLRPDVAYGQADPGQAPIGYRTRLVWRLADQYYNETVDGKAISEQLIAHLPPRNIRPHVNELLPLLQSLRLDYAFVYRSVALEHRLEWLKLPAEIDLGSPEMAASYARTEVTLPGGVVQRGRPIVFGVTIPRSAANPALAEEFVRLLIGDEGRAIVEKHFMEPIAPAVCSALDEAPEALRPLMKAATP